MRTIEKEKINHLKEEARAKVAEMKVQEDKSDVKRVRVVNTDAKIQAFTLWKAGRSKEEIIEAVPDVKVITLSTWLSDWKRGQLFPKGVEIETPPEENK